MRFTVIAAVALTLGGSVAQAENLRRRGLPDLGNSLGSSKITKIVSFGDSLTDTGVVANLTKNNGPASQIPSNAYYNGRFTNGPVWLEYVAQSKSLDLENYAAGGATTSDVLVQGWVGGKFGEPLTQNGTIQPVPGVDTQISSYIKPPPSIFSATGFDFATQVLEWAKELLRRPETLYTIFSGANDYFDNLILGLGKNGSYFAAAQYKEWENLANFGALKIMPMVLAGGSDDFGTFLTAYGDEIDRQIVKFKGRYPWVKIFKYVVPGAAFVNTTYSPVLIDSPPCCTGNCFSGLPPIGTAVVCSNPNAYLGWDGIHPTTVVHNYIANDVISFIGQKFGW